MLTRVMYRYLFVVRQSLLIFICAVAADYRLTQREQSAARVGALCVGHLYSVAPVLAFTES